MNDLQFDNVATDIAVIKVMEFPNEVARYLVQFYMQQ